MAYSLTYSYDSTSESYSVTGYSNITTSDKVVIPNTYKDGTNGEHPVTSIGNNAFRDCSSLTSVTIPNSVTSIGFFAFYGCTSLTSVTIPNSVTSIGDNAFRDCSSLTSVTIGNNVTSIGYSAFGGCSSLTSVTIGNSATSIGDSAFRDCSSLTSVYITDIAAWCKISFSNTYSNPLYYAHNLYLNNELVTELTIPDSVTSIGSVAFAYCSSLTSVTIGNSVTSIGSYAFSGCSSLKQLILLPSTPPNLGSSAIPSTISKIYVPKSSKAAYQAATNWTTFASKIVWDNIYLSFARFNQKNKEYINGKVDELSTKVAPILSDYVDDALLGG